jgi:4-alpha-glucanotransferase
MFELCDAIRVDHFRGFDAYWEVQVQKKKTAINGRWVKAPGKKLFKTIKKELGELPIIAEDLGVMTPAVEDLRDSFQFSGDENIAVCFRFRLYKQFFATQLPAELCYIYRNA